ncbi:hypothetical protein A33M_0659 [Rhodovulum sp. PH10]|uniref:hypothetical protein n=1 Tax=Rhodovulum sp. PH10 TaxID=1187851 RepID=UPI00027C2BD4|nr:hypothetical protein [Rhodovulum sp. PH10]EJW10040.1 hypothetical protein A33M_0659 [Rhodovulum sp. PH10]
MDYFKIDHHPIEDGRELECRKDARSLGRPFDDSELDKLPQPTDDDPPYRPWWVVDRT